MSARTKISNAQIINDGKTFSADILIQNGKIERIDSDLSGVEAQENINAEGQLLLPGLIDDQVHFREPGLTYKADIRTESQAAVAGGVTSYFEMPNVNPPTINSEALEEKYARAASKSSANHAFYLGGTNDNLEDIKSLDPNAASGIKVFMGSSTGNMLVDDPDVLNGIFKEAPCIIATHCEDTPMITANEEKFRAEYGENPDFRLHAKIRSEEACYKSSSLAVSLAKEHNTRLHVLHLTTAKELAQFEIGPLENKRITCEVCAHHLWFSEEDYDTQGAKIKCNPAIKRKEDRDALRKALFENRIDVIATDHAPHTAEEKAENLWNAPSGLPLVQFLLPSLIDLARENNWPLEFIIEKACHAPARLFDIPDRGYIREGYWADLVLVDPNKPCTVEAKNILSKCGWSPFEGHQFSSSIASTFVNGDLVYHDGRINEDIRGQRIRFDRK